MTKPIDELLTNIQQRQQQIPLLIEAVKTLEGESKLQAIQQLQQLLNEENLLPPVQQHLQKQQHRAEPIDILGFLWDLQSNVTWLHKPAERLHRMRLGLAKYLTDTGIADYLPEMSQAWFNDFSTYTDSRDVMRFFYRWYPTWLRIQHAIEDGFITCPLDVYRWQKHKPQRFQWGRRTMQRAKALKSMPPIVRENVENDPEYQVGYFIQRPRAIVLEG